MVRKYYQSLNSLKFAPPMTGIAFLIFVEAFLYSSNKTNMKAKYAMVITALILAAVMFFYYKNKLRINNTLKKIDNVEEYTKGGMVNQSYILNDRMLLCNNTHLQEMKTKEITELELEEKNHGKYLLHIKDKETDFPITLLDKEEGQRLAAFLRQKNPQLQLKNIEPKGNGTLKDLGAGVQY